MGHVLSRKYKLDIQKPVLLDYNTRTMLLTLSINDNTVLNIGDKIYILNVDKSNPKNGNFLIIAESVITSIQRRSTTGYLVYTEGSFSMVRESMLVAIDWVEPKSIFETNTWIAHGDTLKNQGKLSEALKTYYKGVESSPQKIEPYLALMQLYNDIDEPREIVNLLDKAWHLRFQLKNSKEVFSLLNIYLKTHLYMVKNFSTLLKRKKPIRGRSLSFVNPKQKVLLEKLAQLLNVYKTIYDYSKILILEYNFSQNNKLLQNSTFLYLLGDLYLEIASTLEHFSLNQKEVLNFLTLKERDILTAPILNMNSEVFDNTFGTISNHTSGILGQKLNFETAWDEYFYQASLKIFLLSWTKNKHNIEAITALVKLSVVKLNQHPPRTTSREYQHLGKFFKNEFIRLASKTHPYRLFVESLSNTFFQD